MFVWNLQNYLPFVFIKQLLSSYFIALGNSNGKVTLQYTVKGLTIKFQTVQSMSFLDKVSFKRTHYFFRERESSYKLRDNVNKCRQRDLENATFTNILGEPELGHSDITDISLPPL